MLPLVLLLWCAHALSQPEETADLAGFEFDPRLPWLNVSRGLTLEELRGKAVLLDFWTYGCINCIHVLEDLKRLERKHHPYLVVIGVHSPKFDREKNLKALRNIVVRYAIDHPVVNDVEFQIGRHYGMRAWPTQVLIDPLGEALGKVEGEGNFELLDSVIGDLLAKHREELDDSPLPVALERSLLKASLLAAPGKIAVSSDRIAISDTLHHRVLVADHSGQIKRIFGGNRAGYQDGAATEARFTSPQGLVFIGNRLYLADTGNHRVRQFDLETGQVSTIAGNGTLELPRFGEYDAQTIGLRSPWGLAVDADRLYIAMAGSHQIWRLRLSNGKLDSFAGSGIEGLKDGPSLTARFSQPSGLSVMGNWLYVADAEDSAVRRIHLESEQVETLVGTGLFDFGDRDGPFNRAELQHVLGVAAWSEQLVIVADTYNSKLKLLDLEQRQVRTLRTQRTPESKLEEIQLDEPGGIAVHQDTLFIADTNNNRILRYDLRTKSLRALELKPPD